MLRIFGPNCTPAPIDAAKTQAIPAQAVWIDLLDPQPDEEKLVEELIGQNIPTRDEMLEIEPSSRLYERGGALFMTAAVLYGFSEGNPNTDPVGFILTDKHLVTVRYIDPKTFVVFSDHLYAEPEIGGSALEVLTRLLDTIIDRLADELEESQREMEQASNRIFHRRAKRGGRKAELKLEALLIRIGAIQRGLAEIRDSAMGTNRLLSFLSKSKMVNGSEYAQHIETARTDVQGLLDHSYFLSDNLTFLLDASLGLINLEQNDVMRLFSIFAVVLMPPTLIAGIYGMNFRYMPELDWTGGYPMSLAIILVSAVVPYLLARRSGWL